MCGGVHWIGFEMFIIFILRILSKSSFVLVCACMCILEVVDVFCIRGHFPYWCRTTWRIRLCCFDNVVEAMFHISVLFNVCFFLSFGLIAGWCVLNSDRFVLQYFVMLLNDSFVLFAFSQPVPRHEEDMLQDLCLSHRRCKFVCQPSVMSTRLIEVWGRIGVHYSFDGDRLFINDHNILVAFVVCATCFDYCFFSSRIVWTIVCSHSIRSWKC